MWNWQADHLLPSWLAPNLITLIGLVHTLSAAGLVAWHSIEFDGSQVPSWVWFTCVYLLFMYQTLDALDGKQARRTGSSSPLGQLFDHGCDAICAVLSSFLSATALCGGPTWITVAVFYLHAMPFFASNWEACHTGVMRHGLIGVTEGQFLIMGSLFASGWFGPSVWATPVFGVELRFIVPALGLIGNFGQIGSSIYNVHTHFANNPEAEHQAWDQLRQFSVYAALSCLWFFSPSGVFQAHPQLMLFTIGFIFVYLIARLIISEVTGMYYKPLQSLLLPLPLLVANSYVKGWFGVSLCEDLVLPFYFAVVMIVYLHYVTSVIDEITNYLGIYCFVITRKRA